MTTQPSTFVLVQGAWIGGWYWRDVADILRAKGHRVFTPTLTGLGEREHLLSPDVDLTTHINDILNLIKWEKLSGIVLAGHSYGGMVISGVAAKVPKGTIKSIVYLDAFLPQDGQSLVDIVTEMAGAEAIEAFYGTADPIPPPPEIGQGDPVMQELMKEFTPHPRASKFERLGDLSARDAIPIKTFVYATRTFGGFHDANAKRLSADPAWRVEKIESGHATMIEKPQETAEILLRAAQAK